MKRLLGVLTLFFALTIAASAEVQTVVVTNYDSYGNGAVCYVNPMFETTFHVVYDNLSTNHTSKTDAILLSTYFDGGTQRGGCTDLPANGTVKVDVPDANVYVVVLVTNGGQGRSATKVYWNVYKIDGSISERITVNP
jgi:hypothetical protein